MTLTVNQMRIIGFAVFGLMSAVIIYYAWTIDFNFFPLVFLPGIGLIMSSLAQRPYSIDKLGVVVGCIYAAVVFFVLTILAFFLLPQAVLFLLAASGIFLFIGLIFR